MNVENKQFTPREHLTRTLKYRPHVRRGFYLLLAVALVGLIAFALVSLSMYQNGMSQAPYVLLIGSLLSVALVLEAFFFVRPLAHTEVTIASDKLILKRFSKIEEIQLSAVEGIEISHFPYLGGWFTLIINGKPKIRFGATLERSEYLLESIMSSHPKLTDPKKLENYRRTAVLTDHSWARLYDSWQRKKKLAFFFLAVPLGGAALVSLGRLGLGASDLKHIAFVSWVELTIASFILAFAVWVFKDSKLVLDGRSRLLKDPNCVVRNTKLQNELNQLGDRAHLLLMIAMTFYLLLR